MKVNKLIALRNGLLVIFVLILIIMIIGSKWYNRTSNYYYLVEKGGKLIHEDKYEEALKTLSRAEKLAPRNDSLVYQKLGSLFFKQSNTVEAIKYFNKAIEIDPGDDYSYSELGWSYYEQGDFFEANNMFNKSVQINPKNDMGYIGLGKIYSDNKDFILAEDMFLKARNISSENELWFLEYGTFLRTVNRFSDGLDILAQGSKKFPDNQYILYELGIIYINIFDYDKARYFFDLAIKTGFKNSYCPYEGLGMIYFKQGNFTEARAMFQKALQLNPNLNISTRKFEEVYGERNAVNFSVRMVLGSNES